MAKGIRCWISLPCFLPLHYFYLIQVIICHPEIMVAMFCFCVCQVMCFKERLYTCLPSLKSEKVSSLWENSDLVWPSIIPARGPVLNYVCFNRQVQLGKKLEVYQPHSSDQQCRKVEVISKIWFKYNVRSEQYESGSFGLGFNNLNL